MVPKIHSPQRCPRAGEQMLALLRAGHHLVHLEKEEDLLIFSQEHERQQAFQIEKVRQLRQEARRLREEAEQAIGQARAERRPEQEEGSGEPECDLTGSG